MIKLFIKLNWATAIAFLPFDNLLAVEKKMGESSKPLPNCKN